jgi:hypothetical protein
VSRPWCSSWRMAARSLPRKTAMTTRIGSRNPCRTGSHWPESLRPPRSPGSEGADAESTFGSRCALWRSCRARPLGTWHLPAAQRVDRAHSQRAADSSRQRWQATTQSVHGAGLRWHDHARRLIDGPVVCRASVPFAPRYIGDTFGADRSCTRSVPHAPRGRPARAHPTPPCDILVLQW